MGACEEVKKEMKRGRSLGEKVESEGYEGCIAQIVLLHSPPQGSVSCALLGMSGLTQGRQKSYTSERCDI